MRICPFQSQIRKRPCGKEHTNNLPFCKKHEKQLNKESRDVELTTEEEWANFVFTLCFFGMGEEESVNYCPDCKTTKDGDE